MSRYRPAAFAFSLIVLFAVLIISNGACVETDDDRIDTALEGMDSPPTEAELVETCRLLKRAKWDFKKFVTSRNVAYDSNAFGKDRLVDIAIFIENARYANMTDRKRSDEIWDLYTANVDLRLYCEDRMGEGSG